MSLFGKIFIAILKPVLLGVTVAGVLLLFFPEFRQGEGLSFDWLTRENKVPPRLSHYEALAQSAPAVANIYSISIDTGTGVFRNRSTERRSLGSGVVMSSEGYIITCYHVIKDATSISVQLQDDRIYSAELVGFDNVTDLAVLKIDATDLPVIPQMENSNLRIGDIVMAVGNPLGLGQTITSGIVSRTGRTGLANYFDFIQTDAALNQGNSGGALIDSNGYLVGITNARFSTVDYSRRQLQPVDGVNFAVPYELAKRVMNEIIDSGTVTRGQLGVGGGENLHGPGLIVTSVTNEGPAERAGIREYDILLSIDGELGTSSTASEMLDMVAETKPGSVVTVQVNRNGRIFEVDVVIGKLDLNRSPQSDIRG
ncbi:trypsin-like peptidase domain-containing protein [Glaciecola sp. 1036]|uniref:trypsin-like peptidase domain-containing protein n=1 Tax=Alteromonadaceae TaxID=72275 RepID=UPI003D039C6C